MPHYTLRWANRSNADQDWQISNGDNFTLQPDYVKSVQVTIDTNHTYGIAVTTRGGFSAAGLTYTAATQTWTLASHTPHEWQLATGNNIVTVRCFLQIVHSLQNEPEYKAVGILHEETAEAEA